MNGRCREGLLVPVQRCVRHSPGRWHGKNTKIIRESHARGSIIFKCRAVGLCALLLSPDVDVEAGVCRLTNYIQPLRAAYVRIASGVQTDCFRRIAEMCGLLRGCATIKCANFVRQ